ncbi:MAG: hypothetical protein ACOH1X_07090 [Kaistella sp.]
MKKLLLFVLLPFLSFSQSSHKITIEIDNSQKIIYENTLNKLKADYYKKENAVLIQNYADKYFSEVQKIADYFESIDPKYYPLLNKELNKLKKPGYDILNLLIDLENDNISINNTKYVIQKSFDQLTEVNKKDEFIDLNIYKSLSKIKLELLSTLDNKTLLETIKITGNVSELSLNQLYNEEYKEMPYRDFLLMQYEKYFFVQEKYKN